MKSNKVELESLDGDQSSLIVTKKKRWTSEIKCGQTSTFDEQRSGRPKDDCTPEIIKERCMIGAG